MVTESSCARFVMTASKPRGQDIERMFSSGMMQTNQLNQRINMIDVKEYNEKLRQAKEGIISNDEWLLYCQDLMCQILEDNKDVMIRMKERGD